MSNQKKKKERKKNMELSWFSSTHSLLSSPTNQALATLQSNLNIKEKINNAAFLVPHAQDLRPKYCLAHFLHLL